MIPPPVFIGSEIHRTTGYNPNHPLGIPRVGTVMELAGLLGWLPDWVDSPQATDAELLRFHDALYLAALRRADEAGWVAAEVRERYQFGTFSNPLFKGVYRRAATACGGSILAARLVRDGGVACNLAGGTHHGRPDRASGFCYMNDPVMAILELLEQGWRRVWYVDLDAHHGDGVEEAFLGDARVLLTSVHEAGRWPHSGGASRLNARNFPVPPGLNDGEMAVVVEHGLLPLARAFRPQAVVVTTGADALADDPLSRLSLSNRALWRAALQVIGAAPRAVVLGGGGYNPWAVARCWTGLWGALNGRSPDVPLPPPAEALLRGLEWEMDDGDRPPARWFTTLADPPNEGEVRPAIWRTIEAAMAYELE